MRRGEPPEGRRRILKQEGKGVRSSTVVVGILMSSDHSHERCSSASQHRRIWQSHDAILRMSRNGVNLKLISKCVTALFLAESPQNGNLLRARVSRCPVSYVVFDSLAKTDPDQTRA